MLAHIDVIYCWSEDGTSGMEVGACLTSPGSRCRRLACR